MGKKDPCAVFGRNNDRLFLVQYQRYGLSLYISREKGDHYDIQTRLKDLFSHYNLILRNL